MYWLDSDRYAFVASSAAARGRVRYVQSWRRSWIRRSMLQLLTFGIRAAIKNKYTYTELHIPEMAVTRRFAVERWGHQPCSKQLNYAEVRDRLGALLTAIGLQTATQTEGI